MKRISIILLACLFLLSSCDRSESPNPDNVPPIDQTPPTDTSIYTAENPYVLENIRLTDEESLAAINEHFGLGLAATSIERFITLISKDDYSAIVIRKTSSKSYYWEEGERHIIYTDSVVEIKDKISGKGENYDKMEIGNDLHLIEFFSKSPTGEIWGSYADNRRDNGVVFLHKTTEHYAGVRAEGINVLSSAGVIKTESGTVIDYYTEMSPILKFDTDYLVILSDAYYYFSGDDKLVVDYVELESSQFLGSYVKFRAYEFSKEAHDIASDYLQNLKNTLTEERYKLYLSNDGLAHYNQIVYDAWETYGDRVTE